MNIIHTPDNVLLQKAKPVTTITNQTRTLIANMRTALINSKIGVGLAAPQVGVSERIFLVSPALPDKKNKDIIPIHIVINPQIVWSSTNQIDSDDPSKLEGCLSIPDVWGRVRRAEKIKMRYLDENGKSHTKTFSGFMATIMQHEIDHLNGVLFTHRVLEQHHRLFRPSVNEKGEEIFEEIEM